MCFAGRMIMATEKGQIDHASCYFSGMTDDEIKQSIRQFAKEGAVAALQEIGFYDELGHVDHKAVSDFFSLRSLLTDWREFKRDTWRTVSRCVMLIALGILVFKLGLVEFLRIGRGG